MDPRSQVFNAADQSSSTSSIIWDYLTGRSETTTANMPFQDPSSNDCPSETTSLLRRDPNGSSAHPRQYGQQQQQQTQRYSIDGNEEEEEILETPNLLLQCQAQLDVELDTIQGIEKTVYFTVLQQSPEYVGSIRRMILRAERFDVSKAARRLVSFFDAKLRLFGPGIVGRSIRQSDLDSGDIKSLQSGCFQFLPSRDKYHRSVLCYFPNYHEYSRLENMIKAWWYVALAMLEDDDATQQKYMQRNGMVLLVHHNIGTINLSELDRALYWEGLDSLRQLPIRLSGGVHYCFDEFVLRQMVSLYTYYSWAKDEKPWMRLEFHDGSHTECQYNLLKHGIPVKDVPVSDAEVLQNTRHLEWLRERRVREEKYALGRK